MSNIPDVPRQYQVTFGMASLLHLIWAVSVLIDKDAKSITSIHILFSMTSSTWVMAVFLTLLSIAAIIGSILPARHRVYRVLLLVPQQCILIMSSLGVSEVMISGVLPDGTSRPHGTLIASLAPIILMTCGYAISLTRVIFDIEGFTHG